MKNWMQKYEEKEDKINENRLNQELNELSEIVDNRTAYSNEQMIKILTDIVNLYEEMKREAYELNEKDYSLRKKQLAELKYTVLKQKQTENDESKSWNEYKEDENNMDEDDLER